MIKTTKKLAQGGTDDPVRLVPPQKLATLTVGLALKIAIARDVPIKNKASVKTVRRSHHKSAMIRLTRSL